MYYSIQEHSNNWEVRRKPLWFHRISKLLWLKLKN